MEGEEKRAERNYEEDGEMENKVGREHACVVILFQANIRTVVTILFGRKALM